MAQGTVRLAGCRGNKLGSQCLLFLPSLPAERLKVLACLSALRQQDMDIMKVAPARVAPWGGSSPPLAGPRSALSTPLLSSSCCQLPPFAERELSALLPVSRWSLKNHINQKDG